MIDSAVAYQALISRDLRFDGLFFVGVTSTQIYCRPICPVKTPKAKNCRFFESAEVAEKQGFRPCLRCRPELAPGLAPVDDASRIAHLLINRLQEGTIGQSFNLEEIANQFEISSRQLRRIISKELGVSPIQLLQTRRLLLAKQLLTETKLPIIDIAFASGFKSVRRFNDSFKMHYRMSPSKLRKNKIEKIMCIKETSILKLTYRMPYNWEGILDFLAARLMKQVEWISANAYHRTIQINKHQGWIKVSHLATEHALAVEFTHTLLPVLPIILSKLRNLFDLNACPFLINEHLSKNSLLRTSIENNPGLRVPGAFDGFEMAVRAILGQQITVKAATTLACRLVKTFGQEAKTPFSELTLFSPSAETLIKASENEIAKLGIIGKRAKSIIALAQAYYDGNLKLDIGAKPEAAIDQLIKLPGIGDWTAHYIAMRALRWPDAFPKEDVVLRKRLGNLTSKQAEAASQTWRPWRSYAVLHIWQM